ncbi:MAG: hypothetical protein P8L85_24700 [Rubripirellula sp.]|nr:hypothetical protein [Rubripirellula sp.]
MPLFETNQDAAEFLGWCVILNIGLLTFSTAAVIAMRDKIADLHGRLFGLEPAELKPAYFRYLANYKLLAIVFNVVPYVALKLCG